jgi:hypothetical protein
LANTGLLTGFGLLVRSRSGGSLCFCCDHVDAPFASCAAVITFIPLALGISKRNVSFGRSTA